MTGKGTEKHYEFGKNWLKFNHRNVNEIRIQNACECLQKLCGGKENIAGKVFMDIGCGSGIHSLAAMRLGAARVISWDYDSDSVVAAIEIRTKAGYDPALWQIFRGDVLDTDFLATLPAANIVYSWGVLHHTGDLWQALRNVRDILLKPGMRFCTALYTAADSTIEQQQYWIDMKRRYNQSSPLFRKYMEVNFFYKAHLKVKGLKNRYRYLKRTIQTIREYHNARGMSFWCDIRDWLGGYPMEYSNDKDVIDFFSEGIKTKLEFYKEAGFGGNSEYRFLVLDNGSNGKVS